MISPQTISRACSRHPWTTVGAWVVAIAAAVGLSSAWLSSALTTDMDFTNNPESKEADRLVERRLHGEENTELIIVGGRDMTVEDRRFRDYVTSLEADVVALGPGVVKGAATYYRTGDESLVSTDRRVTLVALAMTGADEVVHQNIPRLQAVLDRHADPAFQVLPFGEHSINREFDEVAKKDLASGELIGIVAALVILLVVFRSVVAGVVPILMGLASTTIALGAVARRSSAAWPRGRSSSPSARSWHR